MRKHLRYARYVLTHKWCVLLAGRERGVPLLQLLIHDWSKFLPDEWRPYAEWFYGNAGGSWHPVLKEPQTTPDAVQRNLMAQHRQADFQRAFLLHLHRSPHHHQYWTLPGYGDKPAQTYPIPDRYRREMVADWDGAGRAITGTTDTVGWYGQNRDRMLLHPETRRWVESQLGIGA